MTVARPRHGRNNGQRQVYDWRDEQGQVDHRRRRDFVRSGSAGPLELFSVELLDA